jgi:hypothetical protein
LRRYMHAITTPLACRTRFPTKDFGMVIKEHHTIVEKWPTRQIRRKAGEPGAKEELLEKAASTVSAATRFVEWRRVGNPNNGQFNAALMEVRKWEYGPNNKNKLVRVDGRKGGRSPLDVEEICSCGCGASFEPLYQPGASPEKAAMQVHIGEMAQKMGFSGVFFG